MEDAIPQWRQEWLPVEGVPLLGVTCIGSHMWGTNHPGSDIDLFSVVATPARPILRGDPPSILKRSEFRSNTDHGWPHDIHTHDLGRTVDFVLSGNVNFVVGAMSPIVLHSTPIFEELRKWMVENPNKESYHSIRGMTEHNLKRYGHEGSDGRRRLTERGAGKLLVYLEFGIHPLREGEYRFGPPQSNLTLEMVLRKMMELDKAYDYSDLEPPAEDDLRNWLWRVRHEVDPHYG